MREQLNVESVRHREAHESANCRLRAEEVTRSTVEERFDKAQHELQHMRSEHTNVSFLYCSKDKITNFSLNS